MQYMFCGLAFNPSQQSNEVTLFDLSSSVAQDERPTLLFDLDGTLSNDHQRKHLVECSPKQFKLYYDQAVNDQPNDLVALEIQAMWKEGFQIMIVTGRPDSYLTQTVRWLQQYNLLQFISCLIMRHPGDYSVNADFKLSAVDVLASGGTNILRFYDDNEKMVDTFKDSCIEIIHPRELFAKALK